MNKALVTGCGGFIGSYLAEFLLGKGVSVYGTVHHHTQNIDHLKDKIAILKCDLLDKERVEEIVREVKPDYIFHLAAQSIIPASWQDPEDTLKTNIMGTLYLLDGIRKAEIDPLVEVACSSAEYGFNYENEAAVKEDREFRPSSAYSVSKVGQDMLAYLYWRTYKLRIIRVRPFNITGPRKTIDASSDFARGIVEIENGQRQFLAVGNLEAVRDIVDVRDCVRAMWLLARKGTPGEAYNICSGTGYRMGDILKRLISLAKTKIEVRQEPQRLRPLDEPILIGDNSKVGSLGWAAEIPIEKTLSDLLNYCRAGYQVSKELNGD
jgi:GDP-4-dehydro-6-deoxy-D-mannose reductase